MRLPLLLLAWAFAARAVPPADFQDCVRELRADATARGIKARTFDKAFKGVEPDPTVLDAMQSQPEFETPVWEYLGRLVDDKRVADGRARLEKWSDVLDRIERRYGVDRYTLVAVWGVESDYGRIMGQRSLVRSLATVSCYGERQKFFRGELQAVLEMLQHGDTKAADLKGSWAGAFGHTQFMPSTFQKMAVDFDGDGRRDLVGSVPDALASVANFLRIEKWMPGQGWGYEVRLPRGYHGPSGRHQRRPMEAWRNTGITRIDGSPLQIGGQAALLLPTGTRGPAFIVFQNFNAIHAYNRSEAYALAIAHLADRMRGMPAIATPWPIDDPILSRTERKEMQQLLIARGFLEGEPDGIVDSRTTAAVKAFQAAAGLAPDGYPSARVLKALRGG